MRGPAPDEERLVSLLAALAALCGFEHFGPEVIGIYDRALSRHGYARACEVVQEMIMSRRSRDPFPSVRDIEEKLAPAVSDDAMAVDVASRILAAHRRHGYTWFQTEPLTRMVEELGSLGVKVVSRWGGWTVLCEDISHLRDLTSVRAQLRDLAKSVIQQARLGVLDRAPELPQATGTLPARRSQLEKPDPVRLLAEARRQD